MACLRFAARRGPVAASWRVTPGTSTGENGASGACSAGERGSYGVDVRHRAQDHDGGNAVTGPPIDVLPLFPDERAALLELLEALTAEEWHAPTVCPGWSVKDIAAHLLADDVGRLSRGRDGFANPTFAEGLDVSAWAGLLAAIDRQNDEWVRAMRRVSPPLLMRVAALQPERGRTAYFGEPGPAADRRPGRLGRSRAGAGLAGPRPRVHGALDPSAAGPRRGRQTGSHRTAFRRTRCWIPSPAPCPTRSAMRRRRMASGCAS